MSESIDERRFCIICVRLGGEKSETRVSDDQPLSLPSVNDRLDRNPLITWQASRRRRPGELDPYCRGWM